jgi:hypothetical protein
MCWCRPHMRTPDCGRPECHPPGQPDRPARTSSKVGYVDRSMPIAMRVRTVTVNGVRYESRDVLTADDERGYVYVLRRNVTGDLIVVEGHVAVGRIDGSVVIEVV